MTQSILIHDVTGVTVSSRYHRKINSAQDFSTLKIAVKSNAEDTGEQEVSITLFMEKGLSPTLHIEERVVK